MSRWLFLLTVLLGMPTLASAQQADPNKEAKDAIRGNAQAYVNAFQAEDAKAMAALWTPDGTLTELDGKVTQGREALEKLFASHFGNHDGLKLRIHSHSLKFLTPDVAVEDGVSSVYPADGGPPSRASYTIIHVKKDGRWWLSSVREGPYTAPSNYDQLQVLEWLVGEWASAENQGHTARLTFSWAANRNFLVSSSATTFKDVSLGGGTEWIAWDPASKKIRSWFFETNGGFGEGTWSQDGNNWTVTTTQTLRDGKKMVATLVLTRVDANTIKVQAKNRTLDGNKLPDAPEVTMKRVG